jgi:aspartyl-tRNA(Asn)/glutamyl-tRNA(Gln) amidotransferase subunit A
VTFEDWQQLVPEAAAREIRLRAGTLIAPGQQRAVFACMPTDSELEKAFSASTGALRGVPYMVKDMFDVLGTPTMAGSSFLNEVRADPVADSRIVRVLRDAGGVMAGKTQTFEFAWGLTGENAHYGDCEHPAFPGRTTGGSSSGSAAVVAADVVPLSIGTDTGGSIRVPAAFCGIFGYRGAPGDALITDAVPLAPSFDTAGWFTRTAPDMLAAIRALVGLDAGGGVPRGLYLDMPGVDQGVATACHAAAARLRPAADSATGDRLREIFAPAAEVYGVLAGLESLKVHRKWSERHRGRYGPLLLDRIDRARGISPAQVAAVEPSFQMLRQAWDRFFVDHDFLVMPSVPFPALVKADCTLANRLRMMGLTAPASLGGLPVLAVPVALPSGLTAGLQVIVKSPRSPVIAWALEQFASWSAGVTRRTGSGK